jgi:hypothetical protein
MNAFVYKNLKNPPQETSVSAAARELIDRAESRKDCKPHHLAQQNLDRCAIGDESCKRFWRSVWVELMLKEYAQA